ncbi:MAG: EamA/RhaT family transporter [Nitrospirae bacterium]|nr:MAG: EamA/RhaT family transporter [Nitrospirota bacterium]
MTDLWVALSLFSAFSLATSDALTKRALNKENEYIIAWLRLFCALPFLVLLLVFSPFPDPDSTFYIACFIGIPLEILALIWYVKALRLSPMSLTLPFLALTPAFIMITGWVMMDEVVSLRGGVGVILIALGGYLLNISDPRKGVLHPFRSIITDRGIRYMIGVSLIYSFTSVIGKIAILHSSPLFFSGAYFVGVTLCFSPVILLQSRKIRKDIRQDIKRSVLPGIFYAMMIISHVFAITMTKVAYMIALKRTSFLMGAVYGFLFFREKNVTYRLTGAVVMFLGFLLIVLK